MTEPDRQRKMLAPDLIELADGCLRLSFDAAPNQPEVDWLLTRDWLASDYGAIFDRAFEYPTFEWHANGSLAHRGRAAKAELWWTSFPDELSLCVRSPLDNDLIHAVRARLPEARPKLGNLKTMDSGAWRQWMMSLGSPDYGS